MSEEMAITTIGTLMSQQAGASLCSIKPESGNREQAKIVYNAMNNPTYKLADFINNEILVENVLIEINDILNDETGEIDRAPRVVLIAPDGTSYVALSKGIFNSVKNLYAAIGAAPWEGGIALKVVQRTVGKGKMLYLEMV